MLNKVTIEIGNDKEVIVEVINGYQLNIKFSVFPEIIADSSDIISLKVGKGSLSLFDKLSIPIDHKIISVYEINKIEKSTDKAFRLYTTIGTKTKQFILPCLDFDREYFLYDTFLENVYIKTDSIDLGITPIKYPLFLLYRYSESELYKAFELRIIKHPHYRHRIDINNYEVLFIFDIENFGKDVDKFIKGKYSELSNKLKNQIMKFHKYVYGGTMHQILYRDPKLRKQLEIQFNVEISSNLELYDIPDIKEETYYLTK